MILVAYRGYVVDSWGGFVLMMHIVPRSCDHRASCWHMMAEPRKAAFEFTPHWNTNDFYGEG